MRFRFSILLCCLANVLSQAQSAKPVSPSAQPGAGAEKLVGAWQLVSIETVGPHGDVTYPYYGKHPEGLLVYDRSGWMSVEIVSDPKPVVPRTDSRQAFLAAPPAQKLAAVDGFYAYYGTWTVDSPGATVTHHVRQSLLPGERGEE